MLALARTLPEVYADIDRASRRFPGSLSAATLIELTAAGLAQCFPLPHSVLVCSLGKDGTATVLAGAGRLDEIVSFEPTLCRIYAQAGAHTIAATGRRGWIRALAPLGWTRDGERVQKCLVSATIPAALDAQRVAA